MNFHDLICNNTANDKPDTRINICLLKSQNALFSTTFQIPETIFPSKPNKLSKTFFNKNGMKYSEPFRSTNLHDLLFFVIQDQLWNLNQEKE